MRRVTVAVRRRESLAVAPEVFADFLLRRQHVHPATRGEGPAFVEVGPGAVAGVRRAGGAAGKTRSCPAGSRATDRPGSTTFWARGTWLWRAQGAARDQPRVAFFLRDFGRTSRGRAGPRLSSRRTEQRLIEVLERHGASFATDLARLAAIEPSRARRALGELMGRGLVTNDRFDPLSAGSQDALLALSEAARSARQPGWSLRMRPRRSLIGSTEGRWSRLDSPAGDPESRLLAWAAVLLERYGVLARGRRSGAVGPVVG